MSQTAEAILTDFLRDPKAVVDRLQHVDVVLHRRNAEDLHLSLEPGPKPSPMVCVSWLAC
jgi:hypothetical protein